MTFDELVVAYTAGLDAQMAILAQVEELATEQRATWSRNELLPLGGLATRRAALMHELAAVEARIAPLYDRLRADLERALRTPGYGVAEARRQEARGLIYRLMAADRKLLTDLETSLESRRRESHTIDTGNATLAAYRRVVVPTLGSAGTTTRR